jgi:hypothetical protein
MLGVLASLDAGAQVIVNAPGFVLRKPEPGPPDVRPAPLAWPRLDPGATLCRTEGDLERLSLRRQGDPDAGPADCRPVNTPIAVTILQRKAGRTQVRFTDTPTVTGWTDAWLPDKTPATAVRQTGR